MKKMFMNICFWFSAWLDPTLSDGYDSFIVVHYLTSPPTQLFMQISDATFAISHNGT